MMRVGLVASLTREHASNPMLLSQRCSAHLARMASLRQTLTGVQKDTPTVFARLV